MKAIKKIIESKEKKNFKFSPDYQFYKTIKINQKRWGMLYRGEIEPTISELKRIADYFEVPLSELIKE